MSEKNDWDEMTPRERDALVAEKVMGWEWVHATSDGMGWCDGTGRYTGYGEGGSSMAGAYSRPFSPSTDIACAWEVVEKVVEKGERFYRIEVEQSGTYVEIPGHDIGLDIQVSADTAPEAICLAALRTIFAPPSP